ncbi:8581_t:CDS:2 [Scutellospora calospora]|uniref:8581_t:CDS:1 n=1 Tax=Scutellospora calospora TaxID=85575 RepID=A0ACA9KUB9_9GLOM|nr:8581_t:CDS:2 [Scutellospora calospora]
MLSKKILTLVSILTCSLLFLFPFTSISSPTLLNKSEFKKKVEKGIERNVIKGFESKDEKEVERIYNLTISKGDFAPDGFKRQIYLINGGFPGPLMEANCGDTIVINVENKLNEDTTIHSHGIYQRGTPWFDGVPGQSQCSIPAHDKFTYKFKVDQSGTYWYHSHSRAQYIEGMIGALVIHDPKDPYKNEYDEEIIVILQDWYHNDSTTLLATFLTPESQGNEPVPDNGLINGKNSYNCSWAPKGYNCVNNAPLSKFKFVYGKKYRIRIINASAFSAFIFSIDGHPMDVIEVEGMMTKRHTIHRLPINIAQRYSVIVTANKPKNSYWMRAEMETACFATQSDTLNPLVKAIVEYDGCTNDVPTSTAWSDNIETCIDLDASDLKPYVKQKIPDCDYKLNVTINFQPDASNVTLGYINNSTYVIDTKYPTLKKIYDDVKTFAPDQNVFLINSAKVHGHVFWILGIGKNGTTLNYSKLNTYDPIQRDTSTVPAGGWAVFRFVADNPGWHVQSGLVSQFVVSPDKIKKLSPPEEWKEKCK